MTTENKKFGNVTISPVNMENRREVDISPGDTVRVWQKVREADGKIRLQPFEGVVLARKHGTEPGATFTVRRTSDAYGTEKIFPLYSPMIDKIEIVRRAKMRRAKLYHIRKKAAREIKRKMRNMMFVDIATESDTERVDGSEAGLDSDGTSTEATVAETEEKAPVDEKQEEQTKEETETTQEKVEEVAQKTEEPQPEKSDESEVEEKEE